MLRKLVATMLAALVTLVSGGNHSIDQRLMNGAPEALQSFAFPVAIAPLPSGNVLIFNYHNIFLFSPASGTLERMMIALNGFKTHLNPTGGAFDRGRLFIANYTGNDILEATVDEAGKQISIVDLVADDKTISPESIALSDDFLAAADYDGNNVQIFKRGMFHKVCDIPVKLAHGVGFVGNFLYATSLDKRAILKIDPRSCEVAKQITSVGWEPGQYLWPTSIGPGPDGTVMVSDAHTGRISMLDPETLAPLISFGENGPGAERFNMPYSATLIGKNIWITSSFQDRIVVADEHGTIKQSWTSSPDRIWSSSYPNYKTPKWRLYVDTSTSFDLDGTCYHPAYGHLARCDNGAEDFQLPAFKMTGAWSLYFLQVLTTEGETMIFSPQSNVANIFPSNGAKPFTEKIPVDSWLINGKIVSPRGRFSRQVGR